MSMSNKRKANLLGSESLNFLKYLSPQTVVNLDAKSDNLIGQSRQLTIEQFRTLIRDKSQNFEDMKALLDSETFISAPIN